MLSLRLYVSISKSERMKRSHLVLVIFKIDKPDALHQFCHIL